MIFKNLYPDKILTAKESVKKIKSGSIVFIGTGYGEPQQLIRAMLEDLSMQGIIIYQILSSSLSLDI